jgi:hypothetical protein
MVLQWHSYFSLHGYQCGLDAQLGVRASACRCRTSGLDDAGRHPFLNVAWCIRIVIPHRLQEAGEYGSYAIEP